MEFGSLIEQRRDRLGELEQQISAPDFYNDANAARDVMREHTQLKKLMALWEEFDTTRRNLVENRELAKDEDGEIAEMAAEEIPGLDEREEELEQQLQYALLPQDPTEERNALLEIRAGAGGDEASLFAGELMRLYQRYAAPDFASSAAVSSRRVFSSCMASSSWRFCSISSSYCLSAMSTKACICASVPSCS